MYNAAPWIGRCLDSVMRQTIGGWECLLVDNASTDDSLAIAKALVRKAGRERDFVFIEKGENEGPGMARNAGIEAARGEYVAFLDADDWLDDDIYERLLSLTASQPDIILGNTNLPADCTRHQLLRRYPPSSCFHLYRRDFLINQALRFPPERSSEDSYFVATCLLVAQTWLTTPLFGYHIFKNPQSVSRRRDPMRYRHKLNVFKRLIDFAEQRGVLAANCCELRRIYLRKALYFSTIEYLRNNRPVIIKELCGIFTESKIQLRRLRNAK